MTFHTMEEVDAFQGDVVYLEYRYPEYNGGYRKTSWVKAWIGSKQSINRSLYGKTWRCWTQKPGAEESKNEKWMEETEC